MTVGPQQVVVQPLCHTEHFVHVCCAFLTEAQVGGDVCPEAQRIGRPSWPVGDEGHCLVEFGQRGNGPAVFEVDRHGLVNEHRRDGRSHAERTVKLDGSPETFLDLGLVESRPDLPGRRERNHVARAKA